MSPHHGSAHRQDVEIHNAGVVEGVCLAIDELHAMGASATADALFRQLFVPAGAAGAEGARQLAVVATAASGGYSTAPKAPPEEHILP